MRDDDPAPRTLSVVNLGRTPYKECWDLQQTLLERRLDGSANDTLLLTEHDHVYTIGKGGDENHLLLSRPDCEALGIAVYRNDRGGDITYHGPGQLVGYPILDLHRHHLDLHRYLRDIEEVVIRALGTYDIRGRRITEYTGVWVGDEKICAIGIKSNRWVTMHGFALNVNTDLAFYRHIIPCGIFERGVTSMRDVLGEEIPLENVAQKIIEEFCSVFSVAAVPSERDELIHHAVQRVARSPQ